MVLALLRRVENTFSTEPDMASFTAVQLRMLATTDPEGSMSSPYPAANFSSSAIPSALFGVLAKLRSNSGCFVSVSSLLPC